MHRSTTTKQNEGSCPFSLDSELSQVSEAIQRTSPPLRKYALSTLQSDAWDPQKDVAIR